MAKSNHWIQDAIQHPGALTAKAKAAGMTLAQFEAAPHTDSTTKHQIALAERLKATSQHRRHKVKSK
jgi:hypothetical protein